MTSSRTPCSASRHDSATKSPTLRLRKRPRKLGIAQNVHTWSQPSEIFKYARYAGVVRIRGIVGTSVDVYSASIETSGAGSEESNCTASSTRPSSSGPKIKSISGISFWISLRYRSARQPATTSFLQFPRTFSSAISRIVSMDSLLAVSMNPHVFTTMTSASSFCAVME